MRKPGLGLGLGGVALLLSGIWMLSHWGPAGVANAKPTAPEMFCKVYADSPLCSSGAVECTVCHSSTPPGMNPFGEQLASVLAPGAKRPLSHDVFRDALAKALKEIQDKDADGDGVSNIKELNEGYLPGDKSNKPSEGSKACTPGKDADCGYNAVNAYKKVSQDFCGQMVTFDQLEKFRSEKDKPSAIKSLLAKCLDTPFWNGKDGVVWNLANDKIRPAAFGKSGKDPGPFPTADYEEDYNIFVYAHTDNHDARDVLRAQYWVKRTEGKTTTYKAMQGDPPGTGSAYGGVGKPVVKERRAGMMTTRWTLTMITMFSVLPRSTAAQMYRAYLGMDIAKREGLYPVANEPADYDKKGVRVEGCRGCHQTLDAMSYPFSRYNGVSYQAGPLTTYIPDRVKHFTKEEGPRVVLIPEAGVLLGKRVKDLIEWGKVASNSDAFAKATVMDYWKLLMGAKPALPKERKAFEKLWKDFKTIHQYSVERMLHAFVQMEVYGAL